MDMGDKDKFELENRTADGANFSQNMPSGWRFGYANPTNSSMGLVPPVNPSVVRKVGLIASCSAPSMADSFAPAIWDHPTSSQNLGICDINIQNNPTSLNTSAINRGSPASLRCGIDTTLEMGWNPPNLMMKGGVFLPSIPGILPPSLSHLPADSAFIERAARFSCFNGGNFGDMASVFGVPEPVCLYSRGMGIMPGTQEVLLGNGLRSSASGGEPQKGEPNVVEACKDVSVSAEPRAVEKSPAINESLVKSNEEPNQVVGGPGNESDEPEFSGGSGGGGVQDGLDEPSGTDGEPSANGSGSKKRKRIGKISEPDQAKEITQAASESAKNDTDVLQKGNQNPGSTVSRSTGKQIKQGSQASDPHKEEYIHVRARRGQATNSHSLAERVRREKISERMKFLQDLVPGCSKVTGKAVMLDEIINYVQSLQRQVEFLSMKLATVNPRLDFNMEGLLTKDILQSRASPSCSLGFSPEMPMSYPPLHPSQHGFVPSGLPGIGSSTEMLRRTISSQLTPMAGGFKEPTTQLSNPWEDELHNVVQMSFAKTPPSVSQEVDGSLPQRNMKVEL